MVAERRIEWGVVQYLAGKQVTERYPSGTVAELIDDVRTLYSAGKRGVNGGHYRVSVGDRSYVIRGHKDGQAVADLIAADQS